MKRIRIVLVLTLLAFSATADQLKPNDYCFGVMGFEGDGGPIFIIADEKAFKHDGVYVGPPLELVPAGFIVNPESDVTFEYRGSISAGRAALEAAGFRECPEIVP
jgi:hypothetical protein